MTFDSKFCLSENWKWKHKRSHVKNHTQINHSSQVRSSMLNLMFSIKKGRGSQWRSCFPQNHFLVRIHFYTPNKNPFLTLFMLCDLSLSGKIFTHPSPLVKLRDQSSCNSTFGHATILEGSCPWAIDRNFSSKTRPSSSSLKGKSFHVAESIFEWMCNAELFYLFLKRGVTAR